MLILNHPLITPLNLVFAKEKEKIQNSLPNDFLILTNRDSTKLLHLAKYCQDNHLSFSAIPTNTTEALLLINLNVRFLLTNNLEFAKHLQKLAETYLFDAKILLCITQEKQIDSVAEHGIDGVIFAKL
ncbi:hypothetical protein [Helicobacter turcicus]|uniref:RCK N-terminal domain-containing protein n=1 Tax=Helicobacter turcicus TaxID=2867412 RepID=A0ABS7JNC2_9HELI|nr:hypothetical protein [Helicobacter turcicus]MBX7490914.1 hypothetical protein [Helicobacter turcicus]MBX7545768.1 hypothetical protein [Helicobacter turcicus]